MRARAYVHVRACASDSSLFFGNFLRPTVPDNFLRPTVPDNSPLPASFPIPTAPVDFSLLVNISLPGELARLPFVITEAILAFVPLKTEDFSLVGTPGLVGIPPTVNTDSPLGYSAPAAHSSRIAMNHCEANKSILVRSGVGASQGRDADTPSLPQRAKVENCPYSTVPPHVAASPSYEAGGSTFSDKTGLFNFDYANFGG